jgi:hypothetical protein
MARGSLSRTTGTAGLSDVWTMKTDASDVQRVTSNPLWDSGPDWGQGKPPRSNEHAGLGRHGRTVMSSIEPSRSRTVTREGSRSSAERRPRRDRHG